MSHDYEKVLEQSTQNLGYIVSRDSEAWFWQYHGSGREGLSSVVAQSKGYPSHLEVLEDAMRHAGELARRVVKAEFVKKSFVVNVSQIMISSVNVDVTIGARDAKEAWDLVEAMPDSSIARLILDAHPGLEELGFQFDPHTAEVQEVREAPPELPSS